MKKFLLMGIILSSSLISNAQSDTTKVEQYCQLIMTPRLLSNKVTIDLDFGIEKSFWSDTRVKTDALTLKKFNTIIDALNYMGKAGWMFINAYPVKTSQTEIYHFAFKKQFLKSELQ
ncbi:MAG: hypothetical protein H7Y13_02495 [Sphingobacteriaceae bacterium]|nr:hypothetical protein [Sphingobacteriaceae bacterium]